MNQNVSTFSTGLRYGIIGGIVSIILNLIMYLTGMVDYTTGKQDTVSQLLSYAVMIGIVVMAIKYFRENYGSLSLGQGLGVSFYTGLFMGLISAIWVYVFFTFIDPGLLEVIMDAAKENALSGGMSEDDYEAAEGMMNAFMTPGAMSFMSLIGSVILTLIIGLVASLIMKKEGNPLANQF